MKLLICDDEKRYLDMLATQVREYMSERGIPCEITATVDPVNIWESGESFDLAFLDIQMEGVDGIALAKELRRRNGRVALFFVTNFDIYQDEAMDLQAFRFFEKPFDVARLHSGLDKAMEYIDGAYVDIFLSGEGGPATGTGGRYSVPDPGGPEAPPGDPGQKISSQPELR